MTSMCSPWCGYGPTRSHSCAAGKELALSSGQQDFHFRYQSNNYGLDARICGAETLRAMKDHVLASEYAGKRAFRELYVGQIVSATVKTPCAASMLQTVLQLPDTAHNQVRQYVEALNALQIPAELDWITRGVRSVADLFSRALTPPQSIATPQTTR